MDQIYSVFSAGTPAAVAASQPLVNGVPVNLIRTAANLNLKGNTQFFQFFNFNRPITITVNNALTGIGTFNIDALNTITGVDGETLATINSGLNTSVYTYSRINSITFNLLPGQTIPLNTTVSIGMGTTGVAVIPLSTFQYIQQVSIAANITSGTMTYTIDQTLDNCVFPTNDYLSLVASGSQFFEPITSMTAQITSKIATPSDIKIPIAGFRITVSASAGSAVFTILQQGAAFR